jgi:hypothetical protein
MAYPTAVVAVTRLLNLESLAIQLFNIESNKSVPRLRKLKVVAARPNDTSGNRGKGILLHTVSDNVKRMKYTGNETELRLAETEMKIIKLLTTSQTII